MSTQQYALRWNNYSTHISGAFDSLRHDENLVDVTLCCDDGKIRAHKIMLSACSPYFRDLFKENPCQHPIIILRSITYSDLSAIVSFMYQGEVSVVSDQLTSFLQTAEFLKVRGLTDSGRESPVNYNDLDDEEIIMMNNNNNESKIGDPNEFTSSQTKPTNCSTPIKSEYKNIEKVQKKRKLDESEGSSNQDLGKGKQKSKNSISSPQTSGENEVYNDTGEDLIDVSELHSKQCYIPTQTATVTATATATYKRKDTAGTNLKQEPTTDSSTFSANKSTDQEDKTTHSLNKPQKSLPHRIIRTPFKFKRANTCFICGKRVPSQIQLKKHMCKEHGKSVDVKLIAGSEEDELLFRCRLCWKGFKHPMSLTLHRDAHEGKTECPVCRRHFSRSYDMRSHLTRIHKMTLSLDAKLDFCEDKV